MPAVFVKEAITLLQAGKLIRNNAREDGSQ